jgi:nitrile hydratase accessory protein
LNRPSDIAATPGLPGDGEGPVFREPWEAQAFAMTLALYEKRLFSWEEWTKALGDQISAVRNAGETDTGENYYLHWLSALERLVSEKGAAGAGQLEDLKRAWDRAARATKHGEPIVLGAERR